MIAESSVNGETVYTQSLQPDRNHSFNNLFTQTVSRQLHAIIDQYIPVDLNIMDSVVTNRLNNRFIYPDHVATEILDSLGNVVDSAARNRDRTATHSHTATIRRRLVVPRI